MSTDLVFLQELLTRVNQVFILIIGSVCNWDHWLLKVGGVKFFCLLNLLNNSILFWGKTWEAIYLRSMVWEWLLSANLYHLIQAAIQYMWYLCVHFSVCMHTIQYMLHVCVICICLCVYVCKCVHTVTHKHVWHQCLSGVLATLFSETGPLTEPGAHQFN